MKKYIVMSIIAIVALLPFAAWADTGGTAEATLTFEAVINMIVDGEAWLDLTIDQPMIASIAEDDGFVGQTDWDDSDDDITVTVQSFTAFQVYSSYFGTGSLIAKISDKDTFLYLDAYALQWEQVTATPVSPAGGFNYSAPPDTGDLTHLIDWGNPAPANMFSATPGETLGYNVQWDPTKLSAANLNADDAMDLTIYFVVTDSST